MTENRRESIKAGVFVLISGIVFLLFLVILLGKNWFRVERTYYTIFTSSVQGLEKGSPVKYLGVPAGVIDDIRFESGKFPNILITMKLKDFVPVKEGTRSMLVMTSLTGLAQIELVGGATDEQERADGSMIPSQPSLYQRITQSLPELMEKLPAVLDRVEKAATNFEQFFGPANQQGVSQVIQTLDKSLETINRSAENTSNRLQEQITSTAEEVRLTIKQTREELMKTLGQVRELAAGEATQQIVEQLKQFTDHLVETGAHVEATAAHLQTSIKTDQKIMADLLVQLREASRSAKELLTNLRSDPSALIFSGSVQERNIPDSESSEPRKKP